MAETVDKPHGPSVRSWGTAQNLDALRHRFGLSCDAPVGEVVRVAVERHGERAPGLFEGMFAAAVVDPSRNRVFAWSDRFGFIQLCYRSGTKGLTLEADARRLHRAGDEPDDLAVTGHLAGLPLPAEHTHVRQVRRLPAGCYLFERGGSVRVGRYYRPQRESSLAVSRRQDLIAEFEQALVQSTVSELRAQGSAVLWLSGGFDSTALASIIHRLPSESRQRMLATVSGAHPGLACDERMRIQATSDALQLPHRILDIPITAVTIDDVCEDVLRHHAPYANLQRPQFDSMQAATQSLGAAGVVSGLGGDELTIDYSYEIDWLRSEGLRAVPEFFRHLRKIDGEGTLRSMRSVAGAVTQAYLPGVPGKLARLRETFRRQPHLVRAARVMSRAARAPSSISVPGDSHTAALRHHITLSSRSAIARKWWYDELHARGLHLGTPFLTRRVVDLVLGTPQPLHPRSFPEGRYKPLLALAMTDYWPPNFSLRFWKVSFDAFELAVLRKSAAEFSAYLCDRRHWALDAYVDTTHCRRRLHALALRPQGATRRDWILLRRLVETEAFLRRLASPQPVTTGVVPEASPAALGPAGSSPPGA